MNPWISIWTKPRETISQVIAENPNRSLGLLSWIYGFSYLLNAFQSIGLGYQTTPSALILLALLIGPFWGYLNISIWSFFVFLGGRVLGSEANYKAVRASFSWSCVPLVITLILFLISVGLFGIEVFLNFPSAQFMSQTMIFTIMGILFGKMVMAIWSVVIYLNALAAVQKFSILKTIFNLIIASIFAVGAMYAAWLLIEYLSVKFNLF